MLRRDFLQRLTLAITSTAVLGHAIWKRERAPVCWLVKQGQTTNAKIIWEGHKTLASALNSACCNDMIYFGPKRDNNA